jgi:hypothetical protein
MNRFENITLIAAVSEVGHYWYSLAKGGTNQHVYLHFLKSLCSRLERIDPDYKNKVLLVHDNVRFHGTDTVKDYISSNNIPMLFTGVAACSASPIEFTFNIIKKRYADLYDEQLRNGYDRNSQTLTAVSTTVREKMIMSASSIIEA